MYDPDIIVAALDPKNDVIGAVCVDWNGLETLPAEELPTSSGSLPDKKDKQSQPVPEREEIQMDFFSQNPVQADGTDILHFLENEGIPYVDKRSSGGSLWMIGGTELSDAAQKAQALGYTFRYKEGGGRATKNKSAWWAK